MAARGKSISLAMILMFILSACVSIDTTVKIEPGFVGQRYKKVCVMANYDFLLMKSDTEKFFADQLRSRGISVVRGQELFDEPKYYLENDSTIAVLKENDIEACIVVTLGSSITKEDYRFFSERYDYSDYYIIVRGVRRIADHAVEFLVSVIDISSGELQWSAISKTKCEGNYDTQVRRAIKIIATDICKRLQQDDVIGR